MFALHHVHVSIPAGGEPAARAFWVDGVGLTEVEKPAALQARGGAWFRGHDAEGHVTVEIHVGVEDGFRPARKAHPALVVADAEALDTLAVRLREQGREVDERERDTFDGFLRFHVADPHGNRVEVLAPRT